VVLQPIAQGAFKFMHLIQSFLIFCHLGKGVLKAELLGLYGAKQDAVEGLNAFHLILNALPTQDGTGNSDPFGIANGHNLKQLRHVITVITLSDFAS
jgi:hypothetical protein